MGTATNEGGSVKWAFHSVVFRDDSESYNHYANGNWQGHYLGGASGDGELRALG